MPRRAFSRATTEAVRYLYRLVRWSLPPDARAVGANASPAASFSLQFKGTKCKVHVVADRFWAYRAFSQWSDGGEVYERVMLECLTRLLRATPHPAFIDIGAFMGHYACYAAALLGDQEAVYAIESNPQYYAGMLRSIELNKFTKIETFNVVLSDRVEAAGIVDQTVLFFEPRGTRQQSVTLDELCRRQAIHPTIVKIDVHGSEGKVLMGMRELMSRCLDHILLELSPVAFLRKYSGGISRWDILKLLQQFGYQVFYIAGHRYEDSEELRQALETGFAYRRVDADSADLLLFDRPIDVFLLCTKTPDIGAILGPSVADPGLGLSML